MRPSESTDYVAAFSEGLLRAGYMLTGVAADLAEDLPPDAYPGEEPAAVVVGMVIGSIRTALGGADQRDVQRATELIDPACDRVLEHRRLACELSRRMHEGRGSAAQLWLSARHPETASAERCREDVVRGDHLHGCGKQDGVSVVENRPYRG